MNASPVYLNIRKSFEKPINCKEGNCSVDFHRQRYPIPNKGYNGTEIVLGNVSQRTTTTQGGSLRSLVRETVNTHDRTHGRTIQCRSSELWASRLFSTQHTFNLRKKNCEGSLFFISSPRRNSSTCGHINEEHKISRFEEGFTDHIFICISFRTHPNKMKTTSLFLFLSALLMSQDVASFSSSHSNLFRQVKPSTAADRSFKFQPAVERRRNEFPSIHPVATKPSTKLMANPGAIAGLMTGGILGGALHAIAGKKNLNACFTICFSAKRRTDPPRRTM